jgi:hypothetical protein
MSEIRKIISEFKKNSIFLPIADYIEARENGNGPHVMLKCSGPWNNVPERAEACPIITERDFGRLGLFFVALAKHNGVLGDVELSLKEVLLNHISPADSMRKVTGEVLDVMSAALEPKTAKPKSDSSTKSSTTPEELDV